MSVDPPAPPTNLARSRDDVLTIGDRRARGKAARATVPRRSLEVLPTVPDRADPVAMLQRQAQDRVPELVPLRYGRMVDSPFAFLRGSAAVMSADLAAAPNTGLGVQACGDAHLMNFGLFSTPERAQIFDINDFDETIPGPWEWDLKRLVASVEVACRSNGFTRSAIEAAVRTGVREYRTAMAKFAGWRTLDIWYASLPADRVLAGSASLDKGTARAARRTAAKALKRDSLQAFGKLTVRDGATVRFASRPPLLVPVTELDEGIAPDAIADFLLGALRAYRRTLPDDRRHLLESFRVVDMARKVVGVGSVGTRAWVILLLGRDDRDPLLLQVKEAQRSVLEPYVRRSRFANSGQRVVSGQRLMQAASDIFLGWVRVEAGLDGRTRDFYLRQLRDGKASADVSAMPPGALAAYAGLCGWTLARAHARSGDPVAISAYLGRSEVVDDAMVTFARAYGDRTECDHEALVRAVRAGRVDAAVGVETDRSARSRQDQPGCSTSCAR